MVSRFSDPALLHPDPALAEIIDLLRACETMKDLDFMFAELSLVRQRTWRVPVDKIRALHFEWMSDFGAFNIRFE
jgi:hypothetical protein